MNATPPRETVAAGTTEVHTQSTPMSPVPVLPAERKTQAQVVIEKFGGEANVAKLLHVARSTVYRWNYARADGGTDGMVPTRALRRLLAMGPKLTPPVIILPADLYPAGK